MTDISIVWPAPPWEISRNLVYYSPKHLNAYGRWGIYIVHDMRMVQLVYLFPVNLDNCCSQPILGWQPCFRMRIVRRPWWNNNKKRESCACKANPQSDVDILFTKADDECHNLSKLFSSYLQRSWNFEKRTPKNARRNVLIVSASFWPSKSLVSLAVWIDVEEANLLTICPSKATWTFLRSWSAILVEPVVDMTNGKSGRDRLPMLS